MLSCVAIATFARGQYFISQQALEEYIADYIRHLPSADPQSLDIDSEAILKAIEAQHGLFVERAHRIYSFSHLTIQEYYTAKWLVDDYTDRTIAGLVHENLTNETWREVFLLIVEMLEQADDFLRLMDNEVEALSRQPTIVTFLKEAQKLPITCHSDLVTRASRLYAGVTLLSKWYTDRSTRDSQQIGKQSSTATMLNQASRLVRAANRTRGSENMQSVQSDFLASEKEDEFFASLDQVVKNLNFELNREMRLRKRELPRELWSTSVEETKGDTESRTESPGPLKIDIDDILKHLTSYLRGTSVLLGCLEAESYIFQSLRKSLYGSLFTVN